MEHRTPQAPSTPQAGAAKLRRARIEEESHAKPKLPFSDWVVAQANARWPGLLGIPDSRSLGYRLSAILPSSGPLVPSSPHPLVPSPTFSTLSSRSSPRVSDAIFPKNAAHTFSITIKLPEHPGVSYRQYPPDGPHTHSTLLRGGSTFYIYREM